MRFVDHVIAEMAAGRFLKAGTIGGAFGLPHAPSYSIFSPDGNKPGSCSWSVCGECGIFFFTVVKLERRGQRVEMTRAEHKRLKAAWKAAMKENKAIWESRLASLGEL